MFSDFFFFSFSQLSYGIVLTCLGDNLLILKRLIQMIWSILARFWKSLPSPIVGFILSFI